MYNALFVVLSVAHGAILLTVPSLLLIGVGFWWNANTISHNFIHRPFFRRRVLNRIYSGYLSLLLGVPQSVWRDRHLSHHAGLVRRVRLRGDVVAETMLVVALWSAIALLAPTFFLLVYLPGVALGLALCQLHGHFEHAGGTTSYYGRIYNWLFFNDGYHVEHHRRPGAHWTELRRYAVAGARRSRWPPVLRWLDAIPLDLESLERIVLHSPRLQRFVLRAHERAFRRVLAGVPDIHDVLIVGGGLFPRTALVLRRLLPAASITIVDANADHLATAGHWLDSSIELVNARFDPAAPVHADLVVIPLSFDGDWDRVYQGSAARIVAVHDWIWSRRTVSTGAVVSWMLLKRLNLITNAEDSQGFLTHPRTHEMSERQRARRRSGRLRAEGASASLAVASAEPEAGLPRESSEPVRRVS